jgi:hypothetical protein
VCVIVADLFAESLVQDLAPLAEGVMESQSQEEGAEAESAESEESAESSEEDSESAESSEEDSLRNLVENISKTNKESKGKALL